MAEESGQKTEKPTPKRKAEARKQGQIPRSPDLVSWVLVLVSSWLIPGLVVNLYRELGRYFQDLGQAVGAGELDAFMGEGRVFAVRTGLTLGVFLAVLMGAAAVGMVAQGGVTLSPEAIKPKLSHLSPRAGVKRLFSTQSAVETAKAVVRLAVLALLVDHAARNFVAAYLGGGRRDLGSVGAALAASLISVLRLGAMAGVLVGLADYAWQRRRINKRLMMTKEEIRQEARTSEGDPLVKGRRRQMHARLSRNQMLAAVSDASVVVVNPTHVAVALAYRPGSVPTVVAKGGDGLALRIRERAFEAGVPVVEARPLARVLFDTLEVGAEVPAQMYEAVAIVIAFVMRTPRSAFGRLVRRVSVPASTIGAPPPPPDGPDGPG